MRHSGKSLDIRVFFALSPFRGPFVVAASPRYESADNFCAASADLSGRGSIARRNPLCPWLLCPDHQIAKNYGKSFDIIGLVSYLCGSSGSRIISMRDIVQSTVEFENWLRTQITLRNDHLQAKHDKMSEQLFEFFRATFYRWCERWNEACPEWARAQPVVAVGDLHIQNFGSWRDGRGRLIWGVNDYDEASTLSFAIDLVRLAASAELASEIIPDCELTLSEICETIRDGYLAGIEGGGEPFVLERRHAWLLRLVRAVLKEPKRFWKGWLEDKTQPVAEEKLPHQLALLLREALPAGAAVEFREMKLGVTKGLGSLGHDRFFGYTEHQGGPLAAEGKSVALSAALWANGQSKGQLEMEKLLRAEMRPYSPGTMIHRGWLIRPLMSDCGRIDLSLLNVDVDRATVNLDQDRLLMAMGFEVANLHLLSTPAEQLTKAISEFRVPVFRKTTETMLDLVRSDYKAWRKYWREARPRNAIPESEKSPASAT